MHSLDLKLLRMTVGCGMCHINTEQLTETGSKDFLDTRTKSTQETQQPQGTTFTKSSASCCRSWQSIKAEIRINQERMEAKIGATVERSRGRGRACRRDRNRSGCGEAA
jgi:hypothetical protein